MLRPKITLTILAVVLVVCIGYDIWAAVKGYEFTITFAIRAYSHKFPIIPNALGILAGYWLRGVRDAQNPENKP